ncbi:MULTISPECIES: allantoinase [Heyndrickxia]|jgi:allantoinase|uniref:Allantoinase n=1 Tax=Heyndrickxia oleronia TaxID=38875 RepID=A0A8E2I986_9BACI|nr:allantoinase [Heyndrickxia oleronia]NYV66275.1 allantoinase [Bacillus sp. Gen3]OJH17281.1 allantoinase [Bacillus obstructivus]MCI1590091.1 allantoinase [Heyndrickxia oleronia]MCI1613782.1 allantoinase [Heyndrickxia oleronia]MCI1744912.1 allantoinase [Heyndrickxia oleronia]
MATFDLLIKNGTIVTAESNAQGDIAIKDGKIAEVSIGKSIEGTAEKVIEAEGLHVFPGLIDSHVHFNEPGRTEWEGLETGSKSLAAGGVTTFFDMPLNSTPPTINKENLELKRAAAKEKSIVNPRFWGGLVPQNIADLKELHENGVIGFKAFMSPSGIADFDNADDETLYKGMKEIASFGSLLAVHAESTVICDQLAQEKQSQGKTSARDFVESRPIISEIEAVRRIISYAEATGCKLHIVHASSRKVVQVIKEAQLRGVDVTVETCPHYLSLTVKDLEEKGGVAKCCPPLRDEDEVEDLWAAVANGEITVIGSDHSPAPASMKEIEGNFFEGWGGISGAQSTLNILLTEGHFKRNLPLEKIVELTATNPAKLFKLENKGTIAPNYDADITIVNLNESFELKKEDLFYRHQHSPYVGKTYQGKVKTTIVNGQIVFENGKIIAEK